MGEDAPSYSAGPASPMTGPAGPTRVSRSAQIAPMLERLLPSIARTGQVPAVLDCGGGSGTYAVPLAAAGADVTVVDASADALATLCRRAEEAGVDSRVAARQGDVELLADVIGTRAFDLVLAHEIIEVVTDLAATLDAITSALRPGGYLSILIGNPAAGVLARALAGELEVALAELRGLDEGVGPAAVVRLCEQRALTVVARHGIGAFSDLVPGSALDQPGAEHLLEELDADAADRAPFAELAGRVHLLLRSPA